MGEMFVQLIRRNIAVYILAIIKSRITSSVIDNERVDGAGGNMCGRWGFTGNFRTAVLLRQLETHSPTHSG